MTMSNVHILHSANRPLAAFLRAGHSRHQKLEALRASNRLPYWRIVFDAAHVRHRMDLLRVLKSDGREIVLDLNFAETAMPGRFRSAVSKLPWGNPERPWEPAGFGPGRNAGLIELLAKFTMETGADAIFASAHAAGGSVNPQHTVDPASCTQLRSELDRAGGSRIAMDFQSITTTRVLRDTQQLGLALEGIAGLPAQNVWLRALEFGATALKFAGEGVQKLVQNSKSRLIRFRDALGALPAAGADMSRSQAPVFRAGSGGTASSSAVLSTRP